MSEAATEKVEATKPVENGSTEAKTETKDEKPTEKSNGNGEAKKDDLDEFGRKRREGKDDRDRSRSPDRRDRSDRKRDYDRRDRWSKDDRGRGRGGRGGRGRGGRGGGRGGYNNDRRNNVRTKFAREEESSDAQEIRRQVEFYFSDSNLPIDKFLLEETGGPENKPFPLKTIHNFKRMRHFQPFSAIVEAVKGSDFLVVNDKDEVYRKEPLDSKFTDDVQKNSELLTTDTMKRSLYVKGFGKESEKTAFEIEEFFEPYGAKSVRLRRSDDGTFKGSVFVEFEDEDAAKQFLEMDDKPKYNDQDLEVMTKQAYVDMKSQMILEGKVKPKSPTRSGFRRNNDRGGRRGSFNGGYKRKRYDDNDDDVDDKDNWRERRERFQKGRGRDEERSRSRSPYRGEKEDADKGAEKTETDEVKTEAKAEETKPEEAKAEA